MLLDDSRNVQLASPRIWRLGSCIALGVLVLGLSPLAFLRPTIGAVSTDLTLPATARDSANRQGLPTDVETKVADEETRREKAENTGEREASKAESASVGPNMTSTIPWVHEGDNSATANIEDLGLRLTRDKEGKVHVTFSRPPTAASVQLLNTLPSIQSLRLTGSGANGTDVALLNELPAVESVHLDGMQFTEGGFDQVKRWAALKGLSLWGDTIDDSALALLQEVPHLTSLNLSDTSATKNGVQFIRKLPRLENLSVMGLEWERRHPDQPQLTDDEMAYLKGMPNLKSLTLGFGTRVSDKGLEQLATPRTARDPDALERLDYGCRVCIHGKVDESQVDVDPRSGVLRLTYDRQNRVVSPTPKSSQ